MGTDLESKLSILTEILKRDDTAYNKLLAIANLEYAESFAKCLVEELTKYREMRKTDLESKLSLLTEILKRQDFDTISFSVELTKTKEPDKRIYLEVSETIETLKHDKSQKRIEYIIDRMLGGLIGHLEPGFLYELENAANHNEARRILIDKFKVSDSERIIKEPLNAVIDNDGRLLTGLDAHRRMREIVKIPIERFDENRDELMKNYSENTDSNEV